MGMVILIVLLAMLAGFAAQRGGVCIVGAISELVEEKRSDGFFYILGAMTISLLVVMLAALLLPMQIHFARAISIGPLFLLGALLYGLGAGLNGGCAVGTLNRLLSGQMNFLGSIIGLGLGFFGFLWLAQRGVVHPPEMETAAMAPGLMAIGILLAMVLALLVLQKWRGDRAALIAAKDRAGGVLLSRQNRGLAGILLLGGMSAALYLLLGHAWDYSRLMMNSLDHLVSGTALTDMYTHAALATAGLLLGMLLAALLGRGFHWRGVQFSALLQKIAGGGMMGFGAGFLAGGNDTLMLYGVPGLTMHAPLALMIIMLVVWVLVKARAGWRAH